MSPKSACFINTAVQGWKKPLTPSNSKQIDFLTQIPLCHSELYGFVCAVIRDIIAAHVGHTSLF